MTTLPPQSALRGFALITLLASAAVGRVQGMSFGGTLYAIGVQLMALVLSNQMMLRCCANPSEEREA